MFYKLSNITFINLTNFDSSKVTNMNIMFYGYTFNFNNSYII